MLTLSVDDYNLDIVNAPSHFDSSVDNFDSYNATHKLSDNTGFTSWHALRLFENDVEIRSCLISASGGASGIHKHSAIIHNRNCIIAVGSFMASIAIPSLDLNWATQTDDATCFGVYESPANDCLISHGELLIARVTYEGRIVWQAGGADIFTNGFQVVGGTILAVDFNDREYQLDINSGFQIES